MKDLNLKAIKSILSSLNSCLLKGLTAVILCMSLTSTGLADPSAAMLMNKIDKNSLEQAKGTQLSSLRAQLRAQVIMISEKDDATKRFRYLPESKGLPTQLIKAKKAENPLLEKKSISELGPGSTGGGFLYYRTSMPLAQRALSFLIHQFEKMDQNYLNFYLPDSLQNKITPQKMIDYLSQTTYSYFQEAITVAPDNSIDYLEADYMADAKNPHIILLKPFFQKYADAKIQDERFPFVMRTIMHETLHLFGIGIHADKEAYDLSFVMMAAVFGKFYLCDGAIACDTLLSGETGLVYDPSKYHTNEQLKNILSSYMVRATKAVSSVDDLTQFKLTEAISLYGNLAGVFQNICSVTANYYSCQLVRLLKMQAENEEVNIPFFNLLKKEDHRQVRSGTALIYDRTDKKYLAFMVGDNSKDYTNLTLEQQQFMKNAMADVCESGILKFISQEKWSVVKSDLTYAVCEAKK